MSIEFPLPWRQTSLGRISDPKISVEVRTTSGFRSYLFLIDTGADLSLAPRSLGDRVGLVWAALPSVEVGGIGQGIVRARLGALPLRVDGVELAIRCVFVDQAAAPYILGRADFLDRFVLTIDSGRRRIVLEEIA